MPPGDAVRISVQSVDDWKLVNANVTAAIQGVLDNAQTDAASKRVLLAHLLDWRDRMFQLAAPNIRVDGQNLEDFVSQPTVGQFDEALDRRVFALREQSHVSDQTVAERRRTVPAQVRDLIADLLDRQRVAESAVPDSADDTLMQEDSDYSFLATNDLLQAEDLQNQELAKHLNASIPNLTQRAQWAQEAAVETAKMGH